MVKSLSADTIPVLAGKPLNRKARGNFNDYPSGEIQQEYGAKQRG